MRIWIEIAAAAGKDEYEVQVRRDSPNGTVLSSNSMLRLQKLPWVSPSVGDAPALATLPELEEAAARIEKGEKGKEMVLWLGRHLFESLLGASAWERIQGAAREGGAMEIELALSLPPGPLRGLPWEAMHDGVSFLAVNHHFTVAVTRVLRTPWSDDEDRLPTVPAPARVLFVIGTQTWDPEIRSGMDVLGLLRGAEQGPAGIDPQVLEAANVERLAEACNRFRPHIVHFVTHGRLKSGEGQLKMRGKRLTDVDWVGPDRLIAALKAEEWGLPSVVLLTGCCSAAGGEHIDPLAAKLVAEGIPVALGMTGRISDRVSRLFGRRCGVALSQGKPLVKALTEGRRAGLQQQVAAAGDDPAWALPSIYLDAGISSGQALVDVGSPSPVVSRVKEYRLQLEPLFCGRLSLVEKFDDLLAADKDLNNLVVYTEGRIREKLGRTRLLHEFAARALRRGHAVVLIDDIGEDTSRLPRSFALLAVDMLGAILEARERFDLDLPADSRLVREIERNSEFSLDLAGADSPSYRRDRLAAFVALCRNSYKEIDGRKIEGGLKGALAADLTQLAADARKAHPDSFGPDHRVVAILGGIGNWGEVTSLLCRDLLGVYGLGTREEPVPVFATGHMADAPELLSKGLEDAKSLSEISYEHLGRLQGEEEVVAYQTVLLHPSRERMGNKPPLPPYVPNFEKGNGEEWEEALRELIEGVPGNFKERLLWAARLLERVDLIVEADEEAVMAEYLKVQKER